ncbi:DUF72 domain-containing protein [Consotaella salsifontis]|uniref:Uncharacterized conserved protein YecE, DUF72 family n=1 Tax=Consotaella salsifontis TaxID=1365950 RepID=A0A1T4SUW9_9HYPH|nr:DUF72 domain-containing protein [Consotaella salsifontis]SKA32064.1 Uncharacterized conserved protein YecE, DUF72 family [Consotaella salsifontis]
MESDDALPPRPSPLGETILIGTAGWTIPAASRDWFPAEGTHLSRYGARLGAAEINSSFYRPHRRSTYEKWAASVPPSFRFSVKLPKAITHERRLTNAAEELDRFLGEIGGLGEKLGVVLVQLPPSLAFDEARAGFLEDLRRKFSGGLALEPRHASWFSADVETRLAELRIARVAADPAPAPGAERPGGWPGLCYHRMHGSPRIYYSPYPTERLEKLARDMIRRARAEATVWAILDNTAAFAATGDALALQAMVASAGEGEV